MIFSSTLRVHAALSVLSVLPFASATHWIFGGTQAVVNTRLDPIVNPGQVSLIFVLSLEGYNRDRGFYARPRQL